MKRSGFSPGMTRRGKDSVGEAACRSDRMRMNFGNTTLEHFLFTHGRILQQ